MTVRERQERTHGWTFFVFLAFLALYPLRHIRFGVDLWDSGYNYANFRYAGPEYMDSMWYFATWIANGIGSLLMELLFADTLSAMNLYTGLTVSLLAMAGFLFCTETLKMPPWLAFLAEWTACGLCWDPTAVLYNYLTYLFLLFGCILLYRGLTEDQYGFLAAAGVLLGLNVGVRFSNLIQAALIIAVWSYGWMTRKRFLEMFQQTAFCMAGYAVGLILFLLPITVVYGFNQYAEGITRLFTMTETAQEYSPVKMLLRERDSWLDVSYWFKRFFLALAVGTAVCLPRPGKAVRIKKFFAVFVTAVLFWWLWRHQFSYPDFHTYEAIYAPCMVMLLSAMAVSGFFLVKKDIKKEDKLVAVMELLLILLTSLGGNDVAYYCINNMFLILPLHIYMLWKLWNNQDVLLFSAKVTASVLVVFVCVLAVRFGNTFLYEEAKSGRDANTVITEIPVLRGIRTEKEKAEYLTGLYGYLRENELLGSSCILYGAIPGVAYYMELPPAMNIWSVLDSYTLQSMSGDLEKVSQRVEAGERPIVILERNWADYLAGSGETDPIWPQSAPEKVKLLQDFMEKYAYAERYGNGKFAVYEMDP